MLSPAGVALIDIWGGNANRKTLIGKAITIYNLQGKRLREFTLEDFMSKSETERARTDYDRIYWQSNAWINPATLDIVISCAGNVVISISSDASCVHRNRRGVLLESANHLGTFPINVQHEIFKAISTTKSSECLPAIRDIFNNERDGNPRKILAASTMMALGDPVGSKYVKQLLRDPPTEVIDEIEFAITTYANVRGSNAISIVAPCLTTMYSTCASEALIAIGRPSIGAVMKYLRHDDALTRQLIVETLTSIDASDPEVNWRLWSMAMSEKDEFVWRCCFASVICELKKEFTTTILSK